MVEPWMHELTVSMMPDGVCKKIAEEIGVDNLLKLAALMGGATFYMPQIDGILRPLREQKIMEEFDGGNIDYLVKKYGVTQRRVYQIIEKIMGGQTK